MRVVVSGKRAGGTKEEGLEMEWRIEVEEKDVEVELLGELRMSNRENEGVE